MQEVIWILGDKRVICQAQSLRLLCSHNRAPDSLPMITMAQERPAWETWEMNALARIYVTKQHMQ